MVGRLDVAVELSGGIRDEASLAAALATGCAASTSAPPRWSTRRGVPESIGEHGDRIAVGARRARHHARGPGLDPGRRRALERRWTGSTRAGCARYVVTDVAPGRHAARAEPRPAAPVCQHTEKPVIAAGGVASLADLRALAELTPLGIEGAIIGTALYTGAFTLEAALAVTAQIGAA